MVAVTRDDDWFGCLEDDRSVGFSGHGVAAGVGGEDGKIDRTALRRARLIEAGKKQKVLDERLHARRFLLDPARDHHLVDVFAVGTEAEQLRETLNRRE